MPNDSSHDANGSSGYATDLRFHLNGQPIRLTDLDPTLLLLDYLRSDEVGLTAAKKGCGQGGCGACTVMLSVCDPADQKVKHRAINACMHPVAALDGTSVTTNEGAGNTRGYDVTRTYELCLKKVDRIDDLAKEGHCVVIVAFVGADLHIRMFDINGKQVDKSEQEMVGWNQLTNLKQCLQEYIGLSEEERQEFIEEHKREFIVSATSIAGDRRDKVNPAQFAIAEHNGSQCGFCSNGFVMNLYSYLAQNPGKVASAEELEALVDGNICRCTGYRPILSAFKAMGFKNAGQSYVCQDMSCEIAHGDRPCSSQLPIEVDSPPCDRPRSVHYEKDHYRWFRPTSRDELQHLVSQIIEKSGSLQDVRLVVGNTSIGVYDRYTEDPKTFIDIAWIPDLFGMRPIAEEHTTPIAQDGIEPIAKGWRVGAAETYSDFIEYMAQTSGIDRFDVNRPPSNSHESELLYMAGRTAGTLVRNAASLGGNTMMVVKHIHDGTPFPSDLFTILCAIDAQIELLVPAKNKTTMLRRLHDFALSYHAEKQLQDAVLVAYHIPETPENTIVRAFKTALREVNSHSFVNAGFSVTFKGDRVSAASMVIGGVGPVAFHAVKLEEYLVGRKWTEETLAGGLDALAGDHARDSTVDAGSAGSSAEQCSSDFDRVLETHRELPFDGTAVAYKRQLCLSYFYKFFLVVAKKFNSKLVTPGVADALARAPRKQSHGTQEYAKYKEEYPVNKPLIKLSAFLQTTGEALYTHDIQMTPQGLHAAYIASRKAKANFRFRVNEKLVTSAELTRFVQETFPAVEYIVTADDISERGNKQGVNDEDPLFADGKISFWGQCLGMVLAKDERSAYLAADLVQKKCIEYFDEQSAILSIAKAAMFLDIGSFPSHIQEITRKGTELSWTRGPGEEYWGGALDPNCYPVPGNKDLVQCKVIRGSQAVGSQIHFYMETQSCYAEPTESGGLIVHPSSQSPDSIHGTVANVVGLPHNQIDVQIKRLGGSYGGKTTRSPLIAASVAFAAHKVNRPVKLVLERAHDTAWSGKRHPFEADYSIAIGDGTDGPANRGKIMGLDTYFRSDGGYSYDCSFTVMDCAQLRSDSAYYVPNYHTRGDVFRTNKASNTAYRSMGLVQANIILEDAIEAAAHHIGMDATDVRGKNLYQKDQYTPSGQQLKYVYLDQVWKRIKKKSDYVKRRKAVEKFNETHRWKKRGITVIPLKYGSGYNLASMEHAGALIEVYAADGTVLVRHGGVEMGQGIMTKIAQIAAYSLGIDMQLISMSNTDTNVIPQPTGTGASTGTQYNGRAVKEAARLLEERLIEFCQKKCMSIMEGPSDAAQTRTLAALEEYVSARKRESDHDDKDKVSTETWATVVKTANSDRLNLSSQVRVKQPGGTKSVARVGVPDGTDNGGISFGDNSHAYTVDEFVGYTYSAACSEVEIDVLTGEVTILRSDVVYDMGKSLNPAVDVGQVEGAFVQGVGYVLTEELIYDTEGRLLTVNTWEYKPPAYTTIPLEFHVELFHQKEDAKTPENPNDLLSSKEVGEPPLVLASTVYFAVKNAIMAARKDVGKTDWIRLPAPLTPQTVCEACAVAIDDLNLNYVPTKRSV